MTETETDERELLTVYLRDHRAGATAGLALVRRMQEQHADSDLDADLSWLVEQIDEDVVQLDELMAGLDISPAPLKQAIGAAAERVGRLKLNDRIAGRSPLSDVVELEALASAVVGKQHLWRSLTSLAASGRADLEWLQRMTERADDQLARISSAHDAVAATVFRVESGPPDN